MLGNWTSHSEETKNLSILDKDGCLDQVKDLPSKGWSTQSLSREYGNVEITLNAPSGQTERNGT